MGDIVFNVRNAIPEAATKIGVPQKVSSALSRTFTVQKSSQKNAEAFKAKVGEKGEPTAKNRVFTEGGSKETLTIISKMSHAVTKMFPKKKMDTTALSEIRNFAGVEKKVADIEQQSIQIIDTVAKLHSSSTSDSSFEDQLDIRGQLDQELSELSREKENILNEITTLLTGNEHLSQEAVKMLTDCREKLESLPKSDSDMQSQLNLKKESLLKQANDLVLFLGTFSKQIKTTSDGSIQASNPAMQDSINNQWQKKKEEITELVKELKKTAPNAPETKALEAILEAKNPKEAIKKAVIETRSMENVSKSLGSTVIGTFGTEQRFLASAQDTEELNGLIESIQLHDPKNRQSLEEAKVVFSDLQVALNKEKETLKSMFKTQPDGTKTLQLDQDKNIDAQKALESITKQAQELQKKASDLSIQSNGTNTELQLQVVSYAQGAVKGLLSDIQQLQTQIEQRQEVAQAIRQIVDNKEAADGTALMLLRIAQEKKVPTDQILTKVDPDFIRRLSETFIGEKTEAKLDQRVVLAKELKNTVFS